MARGINRLSGADLRRAKPGTYGDGNNLFLQISVARDGRARNRSWVFRYQTATKITEMGLGSLNVVGLKEARELAREYCGLRLRGIDPLEHRNAQRAAAAAASMRSISFEAAAHAYIAAHRDEWRNQKHAQEWPASLRRHAFPTIGALPVATIDTALVVKALKEVWQSAPETGARVRGRIEAILDWAAVAGYRSGDNAARWNGHLEYLLSAPRKRRVEHLPAMPWREVPAFVGKLRAIDSIAARAFEFAILAAGRSGEVRGAVWSEVDLADATWVIPRQRMKGDREHRVPLAPRAVQILQEMQRLEDQRVFPGIGESAFRKLLAALGHDDVTVHGFRSAFRDWAGESTAFPAEVCESALAHATGNRVERAYRRGDALAKRRLLMTRWATFCGTPSAKGGTVVAMRRAADA